MMIKRTIFFPIVSSLAVMAAMTSTGIAVAEDNTASAENVTYHADYDPETFILHIPAVELPTEESHVLIFKGDLELVPSSDSILFSLNNASLEELSGHWSYEGAEGPEFWGKLAPNYADCANGHNQSPIDITDTISADIPDIEFKYQATALNIINNGHTIQVNYDEGSSIEVGGTSYKLLQFHFHTLSEHTIKGTHTAMEVHLVHQSDEGHLAVVGVLMTEGSDNPSLATIWEHFPAEKGEAQNIEGVTINATDFLPSNKSAYKYSGSLTTPPCTEGVKWFVLTTPIEVSQSQVAAFESIIGKNFRSVQSLGARTVLKENN